MTSPSASPRLQTRRPAGLDPARDRHKSPRGGWRETVESIVVAFVLAFLFRTFEAEAFVIPTGSMAPTLMGRHKDVVCPQCGQRFAVNASNEVDNRSGDDTRELTLAGRCPNCRFLVGDLARQPSFKGDRILVLKFPYQFGEPQRWDVVVFRYPDEPETNYIKRLIGLPGEGVLIQFGDIYTRRSPTDPYRIAQKPPEKVRAVGIPVYDNDHLPRLLEKAGWPPRWAPADPASHWQIEDSGRAFRHVPAAEPSDDPSRSHAPRGNDPRGNGPPGNASPDALRPSSDWSVLSYRHLVPDLTDQAWLNALGGSPIGLPAEPQLITDFYAYNTSVGRQGAMPDERLQVGVHWVGDLLLSFNADVAQPRGSLAAELNKGTDRFRAEFDLKAAKARLYRNGTLIAEAASALDHPARYQIAFANVDNRLILSLDGKLLFGDGLAYEPPADRRPTAADLRPVTIAAQGAHLRLSNLVLKRDIYYTHDVGGGFSSADYPLPGDAASLAGFLRDPTGWDALANAKPSDPFDLDANEFFVLGDNSPQSRDSRAWDGPPGLPVAHPYAVPRSLMIGKAFFIYWPHAIPFGPTLPGTTVRPLFYPQFGRMRFIK